jgi:hypothetical protein
MTRLTDHSFWTPRPEIPQTYAHQHLQRWRHESRRIQKCNQSKLDLGGLAVIFSDEKMCDITNGRVESEKTTALPDGSGNWQVSEVRQATTRQEGKNSSTEERVSRPDSEGKLGEVSRTLSRESESASGGKRSTIENYPVDVAGAARDGSLHLVERAITAQCIGSAGQQISEKQLEQPNPADPGAGLQVSTFTTDTVRSSPSGTQSVQTVQARDAYGSFAIVSVDTTKSDNIHSIQLQMSPSEKPK